MDLSALLARFPGARLAAASDNDELLRFFEQSPMTGQGLRLRYSRRPDFFAFPRLHSENCYVFFLKDGEAVTAMGTLLTRPGYLGGTPNEVGYLGDLRISPTRASSTMWRGFYSELMSSINELSQLRGCRYFLTAIIAENAAARAALVKPRRRHEFVYDHLSDYEMVSCLFRLPFPTPRGYRVSTLADEPDGPAEFLEFYDRGERAKNFGFVLDSTELERRFRSWPGFGPDRVLLVRDGGRLVATGGLFSPAAYKRILVDAYPPALRWVRGALGLPVPGSELSVEYLSMLQFDSELDLVAGQRAFRALLSTAWAMRRTRLLAYCRQAALKATLGKSGFVEQSVPMALYAVRNSATPPLPPTDVAGFEMALV